MSFRALFSANFFHERIDVVSRQLVLAPSTHAEEGKTRHILSSACSMVGYRNHEKTTKGPSTLPVLSFVAVR